MRTVSFYRIQGLARGGLVWIKIANYSVPEAGDDAAAVDMASRRLERERQLASWEEVADVCLVRMN